ncbi:hypothetical protein [Salsipaludibacter albus]|uniref:hypothetical protein n=1 Tax=Salsipaludibacter albus TaxID=2849650 RepID=UPI001EE3D0CF|nr:hypothetical protein [Salsipaludibacter albus]MBY5162605.1 hypothetical protein [Salsipaludibacter albus]
MLLWKSVLELAARQGGRITIQQVTELGVLASTFTRRGSEEGWTRESRGVWRMPGARTDRLGRLWAAVLACGPQAMVTGADGLWLRGVGRAPRTRPRIVTPMETHAARHLRSRAKVISSRTLRPTDAGAAKGLPCALATRCFVDLVIPPTPSAADVRDLLVTARQARQVDVARLQQSIRQARGVPGLPVLRRAVADVLDVEADSPFSDRVHRRLLREGLRPDPAPTPVPTHRRTLHPDITFTDERVAIECDSMLAHSEQRELMVDNRKDRAYSRAGWEPLRIGTWEFDRHWGDFLDDLHDALAG